MTCALCDRVKKTKNHQYDYLIHEFPHSYLMLGEHQYYPGYCVLVLKDHYREMTDIPHGKQAEFFQEMMKASKAIEMVTKPTKMNTCSLGNMVAHVHWHFFPRHSSEPNFEQHPWINSHSFDAAKVTPDQCKEMIENVRRALKTL